LGDEFPAEKFGMGFYFFESDWSIERIERL
jgi:hypothetical protein